MFELAQVLRDPKISDSNCSYVALVQKEALILYVMIGYLNHFYVFYHWAIPEKT